MSVRIPEPPIPDYWLLDANVLFSDWSRFFCAALAERVQAQLFYTPLTEEEAFRNLVRLNRLSEADAATRRQNLSEVLPAVRDETDANAYLADLQFVQEKDRPIAASALKAVHDRNKSVGLLTWNVKDFPRKQLLKKQVVRYTPDELAVKIVTETGWSTKQLLENAMEKVQDFAKNYPLLEPTEFSQRSQPIPQNLEQWLEFLKRNRLNLVGRKLQK